jgi:hypothetical protein
MAPISERPVRAARIPAGFALAATALLLIPTIAVAKPHVSLGLPPEANTGSRTAITYSASGVPSRARLALQRQQGTARVWQTVSFLKPSAKGTGQLASLPIGTYALRLAVLSRRKVLAQQVRSLKVFGHVPLSVLFSLEKEDGGPWYFDKPMSGIYASPSSTFPYAMKLFANESQPFTFATVDNAACRTLHLDIVAGEADLGKAGDTATISVVQENLDPVRATATTNALVTLDTPLVPGTSWSLISVASNAPYASVYVNGYANCFSAAPLKGPKT